MMSSQTLHEHVVERHGHKYIRLKSGRLVSFWEMVTAFERAQTELTRAFSRAFKLAVANASDYDMERLAWLVETLDSYTHEMGHAIDEHCDIKTQEERITLLRNMTEDNGCTPAEAAAFQAKANQLEAVMHTAAP